MRALGNCTVSFTENVLAAVRHMPFVVHKARNWPLHVGNYPILWLFESFFVSTCLICCTAWKDVPHHGSWVATAADTKPVSVPIIGEEDHLNLSPFTKKLKTKGCQLESFRFNIIFEIWSRFLKSLQNEKVCGSYNLDCFCFHYEWRRIEISSFPAKSFFFNMLQIGFVSKKPRLREVNKKAGICSLIGPS